MASMRSFNQFAKFDTSTSVNDVISDVPASTEKVNRVVTDRDRDAVNGLNDEQWQTVLHLLNDGRSGATEMLMGMISKPSWILDTGASHHMTGKTESLSDLHEMPMVLVILPDGTKLKSVKEGTVHLRSHLVMRSVFYAEEMRSTDNFIVFQGRTLRMVTRVGKRENGTFYFRSLETIAAVRTSSDDYNLWHNRMGHPSTKVVILLPDVVVSEIPNKTCDTCFRAKQSRDSFVLIDNKSTKVFDLIHCNV